MHPGVSTKAAFTTSDVEVADKAGRRSDRPPWGEARANAARRHVARLPKDRAGRRSSQEREYRGVCLVQEEQNAQQ